MTSSLLAPRAVARGFERGLREDNLGRRYLRAPLLGLVWGSYRKTPGFDGWLRAASAYRLLALFFR